MRELCDHEVRLLSGGLDVLAGCDLAASGLVSSLDVFGEDRVADTPLPAATDLNSWQLPILDERAHLTCGDIEILRHVSNC